MATYRVAEAVINKNDGDFHLKLQKAYKKKVRPLCLCKASGVTMHIAKLSDNYIVKRMPNTGHKHHPDCESFDLPPELSGRAGLRDHAISEDPTSGMTNLKFDFSLSKISGSRAAPIKSEENKTTIESEPTKLSLLSLLHCLYEDAGFNRWSPRMNGKRNWAVIQKHLLNAAANKIVRGKPLTDILLIPETFSMDRKERLASHHKKYLSRLRPKGKTSPLGICIGEVKAFEEARFNYKLVIKHMADMPLYYAEDLDKKIRKHFSREIAMHEENEYMHLIAIATFMVSASGNPTIDSLSLMMVDTNWLPFENLEELDVIRKATEEKRYLIKGLRYNLSPSKVIASFLFSDTGDDPTALYVVPAGAGDSYYEELDRVIEQSEFRSATYDINKEDILSLPILSKCKTADLVPDSSQEPPDYINDVPPVMEEYMHS